MVGPMVQRLKDWLRDMPRPLGVFCCDDKRALVFLHAALELGWRVPEDLGILGFSNDSTFCDLAEVPLSSIGHSGARLGREALKLLEEMMAGTPAPRQPLLVPPGPVVIRSSTDRQRCEDDLVLSCLNLIRLEAPRYPMLVEELAQRLGVGRRTLERRFVQSMGKAPKAEVDRVRHQHACRLLRETNWPLQRIAHIMGYSTASHFGRHFRTQEGSSPGAWRKRGDGEAK